MLPLRLHLSQTLLLSTNYLPLGTLVFHQVYSQATVTPFISYSTDRVEELQS